VKQVFRHAADMALPEKERQQRVIEILRQFCGELAKIEELLNFGNLINNLRQAAAALAESENWCAPEQAQAVREKATRLYALLRAADSANGFLTAMKDFEAWSRQIARTEEASAAGFSTNCGRTATNRLPPRRSISS